MLWIAREHGKSTINSFLLPLYFTLYNKSQFTLIISATESIAVPFLDIIKSELEENKILIEDFGIQKGNRWNNNEILLITSSGVDSCIMIRGIDGSIHKVLPYGLFQIAIDKLKNYPVDRILFETVQAQDYIKTKFEEELWNNKIYVPD